MSFVPKWIIQTDLDTLVFILIYMYWGVNSLSYIPIYFWTYGLK